MTRNTDLFGTYLTTLKVAEELPELYPERELVVIEAGDRGNIPIDDILEPRIRLLAAMTLLHEGLLTINPLDEGSVELTAKGHTRYIGAKALSRG